MNSEESGRRDTAAKGKKMLTLNAPKLLPTGTTRFITLPQPWEVTIIACLHLHMAAIWGSTPRLPSGILPEIRPFRVGVLKHTYTGLRSVPRTQHHLLKMNTTLPSWLLLWQKTYACKAGTKIILLKMHGPRSSPQIYLFISFTGCMVPWNKTQNSSGRSPLQYVQTISVTIGHLFLTTARRWKSNMKIISITAADNWFDYI